LWYIENSRKNIWNNNHPLKNPNFFPFLTRQPAKTKKRVSEGKNARKWGVIAEGGFTSTGLEALDKDKTANPACIKRFDQEKPICCDRLAFKK